MLECRRVYFGTALRRDVTVIFVPSGIIMEWRSETSGLYIETSLAASHMTSFDMYHGPARPGTSLADDDGNAILGYISTGRPIQDFFAIGLRQKPPHLRSVDGFEPTDEGPRKYIVVVLEDDDALATFRHEAVPNVVWGGHVGWPAAPVLSTSAAARPFLAGVPIADKLAVADAVEDAAALRQKSSRAPRRDFDVEAVDPDANDLNDEMRDFLEIASETRAGVVIDDADADNFDEYYKLIVRNIFDDASKKILGEPTIGPQSLKALMASGHQCDCLRAIERWPRIRKYWPRVRRRICSACGKHSLDLSQPRFLVCGGCSKGRGVARYCSEACQGEHWPEHKAHCGLIHEYPERVRALMYSMRQTDILKARKALG
jgi:hypothetical protein